MGLTFETCFESVTLNSFTAISRLDNVRLWESIVSNSEYLPVVYTNSSIEFQWRYQQWHGGDWLDLSNIILWDNRPVAAWPISLVLKNCEYSLSSQGLPVLPPLFVADCPPSTRKRVTRHCLDLLEMLTERFEIKSWSSAEPFSNSVGLTDWHLDSMVRGASCKITHDLFVNLQLSIEEIKSRFRKSYKSLLNSGLRHYSVNVLSAVDNTIWESFRTLHRNAAGRETRSTETWDIHYNDIKEQRAILVYLLDGAGQMDGAGFFNYTRDEGLYAVAAYNRLAFDRPLGHLVQYRAIEELKKRGIRWYKIGPRPYRTERPEPSAKEISIGDFKQGFASHTFPCYRMTYSSKNIDQLRKD